jgi:hypothetical protein
MTMPSCADCQTMLCNILCEIRELRAILKPRKCSDADVKILQKLLPAIGGVFGSNPVTVREILSDRAIRTLFPGGPGSLGNLLARAAADAANIDGYLVQRVGIEHAAVLWGVCRLP